MSELQQAIASGNVDAIESAFTGHADASDASRDAELLAALRALAEAGRSEQAEMLAWAWLNDLREKREPSDALPPTRETFLIVPDSGQIRADLAELYRAAFADRSDVEDWLNASGLAGEKVPAHRAVRTVELMLSIEAGTRLIERRLSGSEQVLREKTAEVIDIDPTGGRVTVQTVDGRMRDESALRLADDFEIADDDDIRVLMQHDPDRLSAWASDDPAGFLVAAIKASGGRIDNDQLRTALTPRFVEDKAWTKWWGRARNGAKRNKHVVIEGRTPVVLTWHDQGITLEDEALDAIASVREARDRLEAFESYLRQKGGSPDADLLAELGRQAATWLEKRTDLGMALVVHRYGRQGVPLDEEAAGRARSMLASADDPVSIIRGLSSTPLWLIALELLPDARPVEASDPDWQTIFVRLFAGAPLEACGQIAEALDKAGQLDRLNARVAKAMDKPEACVDTVCWMWSSPPQLEKLEAPRPGDLFATLLLLAKEGSGAVRNRVRAALSAKDYASWRAYLRSLSHELAPLIRRQVRRADGLGQTTPEELVHILDDIHPPVADASKRKADIPLWQQPDVIFCSEEALAKRERELDHIQNVEMPANAKAIGEAAAHGDLSENSEYKFALEERDLLRARAARIQNELAMARVIHPDEIPADHVSIYSQVQLAPAGDGAGEVIQIVSPWDSDVAERRYNYQAPLSATLLGRREGDTVTLSLEGEPERDYTIASIQTPDRRPNQQSGNA